MFEKTGRDRHAGTGYSREYRDHLRATDQYRGEKGYPLSAVLCDPRKDHDDAGKAEKERDEQRVGKGCFNEFFEGPRKKSDRDRTDNNIERIFNTLFFAGEDSFDKR